MERLRTPSTTFTTRRGSEGPRHDPYSFVAYTVMRRGEPDVTLHLGLGQSIRCNGIETQYATAEEAEVEFERLTTYSAATIESFFHRYERARYRAMTPAERYATMMAEDYDSRLLAGAY